jgi:hypothetical protein
MARRWQRGQNDSGSLLASIFIIALGSGCCLFTVAAMAPDSMPIAIWTVAGLLVVFLVLLFLQRYGKGSLSLAFFVTSSKNRRDDGLRDYEPQIIGERKPMFEGNKQPITAAEAHEIRVSSANTWVPARSHNRQTK